MTSRSKALYFSILGVLGLGAVNTVGYVLYDETNPTGIKKLSKIDYSFSPPKFTDHKKLDYGCSANLFKEDSSFESNKLYGCGVANMELWDSGNQFESQNKTVDYLIFNSEIALRKGDEGWKINTKFDNLYVPVAEYSHYITTYKKDQNKGWEKKEAFFIEVNTDHVMDHVGHEIKFTRSTDNQEYEVIVGRGDKDLNIKVPDESWYKKTDYLLIYQPAGEGEQQPTTREGLEEHLKESKSWSGIWIEDSNSSSSWIFQNIEIFIEDKKYSKFFCKDDSKTKDGCWQSIDADQNDDKISEKETSSSTNEEETWESVSGAHSDATEAKKNSAALEKIQSIIGKLKDSKGNWISTQEFCSHVYERNISEYNWKILRMFCSAKQK